MCHMYSVTINGERKEEPLQSETSIFTFDRWDIGVHRRRVFACVLHVEGSRRKFHCIRQVLVEGS